MIPYFNSQAAAIIAYGVLTYVLLALLAVVTASGDALVWLVIGAASVYAGQVLQLREAASGVDSYLTVYLMVAGAILPVIALGHILFWS